MAIWPITKISLRSSTWMPESSQHRKAYILIPFSKQQLDQSYKAFIEPILDCQNWTSITLPEFLVPFQNNNWTNYRKPSQKQFWDSWIGPILNTQNPITHFEIWIGPINKNLNLKHNWNTRIQPLLASQNRNSHLKIAIEPIIENPLWSSSGIHELGQY